MAKKSSMVVNGEVFTTKKALTERCRSILYRYEYGGCLSENDLQFMSSLVETYHPESSLKVGCGISSMRVEKNDYNKCGFWLERIDGTTTDFSFVSCITHPSKEKDAKGGFRNAIINDILSFKIKRMNEISHCEYSGESLLGQEVHIDHKPPKTFDFIVNQFMSLKGLKWEDVPIEPTYDGKVGSWISDNAFEEEWRSFHNSHAELRVVTKKCNLSDIKRESNVCV